MMFWKKSKCVIGDIFHYTNLVECKEMEENLRKMKKTRNESEEQKEKSQNFNIIIYHLVLIIVHSHYQCIITNSIIVPISDFVFALCIIHLHHYNCCIKLN